MAHFFLIKMLFSLLYDHQEDSKNFIGHFGRRLDQLGLLEAQQVNQVIDLVYLAQITVCK